MEHSAQTLRKKTGRLPQSPDREIREVLAGVELRRYPSKGYTAIHIKGNQWNRKVAVGKALYKDDLIRLAESLMREARVAKTYAETHKDSEWYSDS